MVLNTVRCAAIICGWYLPPRSRTISTFIVEKYGMFSFSFNYSVSYHPLSVLVNLHPSQKLISRCLYCMIFGVLPLMKDWKYSHPLILISTLNYGKKLKCCQEQGFSFLETLPWAASLFFVYCKICEVLVFLFQNSLLLFIFMVWSCFRPRLEQLVSFPPCKICGALTIV